MEYFPPDATAIETSTRQKAVRTEREEKRLSWILLIPALSVSIVATLGTPLIPSIAEAENLSLLDAQWMMTITLLVAAISTPVLGRLGDGKHRQTVLKGALFAVILGCVISAISPNFLVLLVGRALQGLGYVAIPLSIALARDHLSSDRRDKTISLTSIAVAVGSGLGFPITGLVAQSFDFRMAYWFGALISLVVALLVIKLLPKDTHDLPTVKLDVVGALLFSGTLIALLLGISNGSQWGWSSTPFLTLMALSAILATASVMHFLKHHNPLLDVRDALHPAVLGSNLGAVLMGAGMYMGMALVSRFTQTPAELNYGMDLSLAMSSMYLLPISIGSLLAQPIAHRARIRFGNRWVFTIGAGLVMVVLALASRFHSHPLQLIVITLVIGMGIGLSFAAMPALIIGSVDRTRTSSAVGLNQLLRTVGGSLGSALAAAVLNAGTGAQYPTGAAFDRAFLVGAVLCALTVIAGVTILPRRPLQSRQVVVS